MEAAVCPRGFLSCPPQLSPQHSLHLLFQSPLRAPPVLKLGPISTGKPGLPLWVRLWSPAAAESGSQGRRNLEQQWAEGKGRRGCPAWCPWEVTVHPAPPPGAIKEGIELQDHSGGQLMGSLSDRASSPPGPNLAATRAPHLSPPGTSGRSLASVRSGVSKTAVG